MRLTVLPFLLFVACIRLFAQGLVYPIGDVSQSPTINSANSNGYKITQLFHNDAGHTGVDLSNGAEGGDVHAIGPGTVTISKDDSGGWGNVVLIRHDIPGGPFYSLYAHMKNGSVLVNVGDVIATAGTVIGKVDCTGDTYGSSYCPDNGGHGAHLHFGVRLVNSLGCGYITTLCTTDSFSNYAPDPLQFVADRLNLAAPTASFTMSYPGVSTIPSTNIGTVGAANTLNVTVPSGQSAIINFDGSGSTGAAPLTYTWKSDENIFPPSAPCTGPTCQFGLGALGSPHQISLLVQDAYGQISTPALAAAAVTEGSSTGTVAASGTLDGNSWTSSTTWPVSYTIVDPNNNAVAGTVGLPFSTPGLGIGSYTLTYISGGPPNATFLEVGPCAGPLLTVCKTQLGANQTLPFNLQFTSNPPTAGFTMSYTTSSNTQSAIDGQALNVAVAPGSTASVIFDASQRSIAYNTNKITVWQWTIDSSIVATSRTFSQSIPIGTHTVSLVVADGRGAQSTPATATVVVTTTPSTATWVQQFPATSPPARNGFMMVYDAARSQTVVFGGIGASGTLGDTWVWDGTSWIQEFPAVSPPATHDGQIVYDEARQQTILVGGYTDQAGPTATWIWDGNTWTQASTTTSPALAYAAAAYDKIRQEIVIFGGTGTEPSCGFPCLSNTTWIWNGATWSTANTLPVPPARNCDSMAWDSWHNGIVMAGGLVTGLLPGGFLEDTWIWNGTNWTELFPSSVPPMYLAPFVFDAALGTSVLIDPPGTWTWNGTTWVLLPSTTPSLSYPNMAYDSVHAQIVLFGGYAQNAQGSSILSNQTWILTAQ